MTILKNVFVGTNYKPNSTQMTIKVFLDSDITNTDINTVLPNNGTRFKTVDNVNVIPSGSTGIIYTPTAMIVCTFMAELGTLNSKIDCNEGIWGVLARVPYKN